MGIYFHTVLEAWKSETSLEMAFFFFPQCLCMVFLRDRYRSYWLGPTLVPYLTFATSLEVFPSHTVTVSAPELKEAVTQPVRRQGPYWLSVILCFKEDGGMR